MAHLITRTILALVAIVALVQIPVPATAEITGPAKVIDGDTIRIHGAKIRLHGIDAPESAQVCKAEGKSYRCGTSATLALARRIAGKPVSCDERDKDRYGRIVAVCHAGGGDLNAWLVSEGLALAYRRYSTDYVDQEQAAQEAKRGLWRGEFVKPWQWRKGKRMASEKVADAAPGKCRIKGNISRKGKKIYHTPGGRYYAATKINEGKGERWFCSESEAKDAGWRRSSQ
jgi:endonuclease YncB( thermonuclease family)